MQRIHSPKLEAIALRSITSGDEKIAGWIYPRIGLEHFSYEPSQDFFRRILFLTRKTGNLPHWDDLVDDLAISEDARDEMAKLEVGGVNSRKLARRLVDKLDEYRKARVFFNIQRLITKSMRDDKIDLEDLADKVGEHLSNARGKTNLEDCLVNFGADKVDRKALIELLTSTGDEFIPTGFKAFDSINQGVPRGSLWMVSAPTGAFKSGMALNIAVNQALLGYKISFTSLEMSKLEVIRRIVSRLAQISLNDINRVHQMSRGQKRTLIKIWKKFSFRICNNGGRLTIFAPDEDVSMEEVLTLMKSRGYDNNIIDYAGLLKGADGDDQWRKLGAITRYAKRSTASDNSIVTILAQLTEEGEVRYSRTMVEHASLAWKWLRPDESGIITVKQPKARNLRSFDFPLQIDFPMMTVKDVDMNQIVNGDSEKPKRGMKASGKYQRTNKKQDSPKSNMRDASAKPEAEDYQL